MEQQQQNQEAFNFKQFEEAAVEQLRTGKPLEGKNGVLAPLIKRLVEASLAGEMDAHLEQEDTAGSVNRRNGKMSKMSKRVKTGFGTVDIDTPRDRRGSYSPQILPKRQTAFWAKPLTIRSSACMAKAGDIRTFAHIWKSCTG
jgi:transposase-like protein